MSAFDVAATEPALISDVLNGKKERFQELILRHQKMVYGVAWSQLGNVELAEEAVQQAFVKAYCSLASLRDTTKFRSWLATITRNASVSIARTRRRELSNSLRWEIEPVVKLDGASAERDNLTDELRETVAGLPETHRQVLTLFYLEDQSVKRVAETLDLTESAVKTRLSRARKVLRKELERRLGDSLSKLVPSHSLVLPIMAALPTPSTLGSTAKLSVLGKAVAGTGILSQIGGVFVAMIPVWLLSTRTSKQVAADFKDDEANDFRRKIVTEQPLNMPFLLLTTSVGCVGLFWWIGIAISFFLIAAFCLWGILKGIRHLRVNHSRYSLAAIACLVMWFVVYIVIGICLMTDVFDLSAFGMIPIALPMILSGSIMYRYRSKAPFRADYNLFLRAATGGLKVDEQTIDKPLPREPSNEIRQLNSSQLESFAKFLGENLVINDYTHSNNSLRMELPAIRGSFFAVFFKSAKTISSITIDVHGRCELCLSPCDKSVLDELSAGTAQRSDLILERAVEKSFSDFTKGDRDSARRTICAIEDVGIFKPEAYESLSRRQRSSYAMVIVGSIFLILLDPGTEWLIGFLSSK